MFSTDEKDAIKYFRGEGLYPYHQNFKTVPNIFDARESFLLKMHDESNKNQFLKWLQKDQDKN